MENPDTLTFYTRELVNVENNTKKYLYNYDRDKSQAYTNLNIVSTYIYKHSHNHSFQLFSYNYEASIYNLILSASNPSGFGYYIPYLYPRSYEMKLLSRLKRTPPEWIIWDQATTKIGKEYATFIEPRIFDMSPEFTLWLQRNYKLKFLLEPYKVYQYSN